MKKKERKALEQNLLAAITKVIQDNKVNLTKKIEKNFKKSIKSLIKKTDKKRTASLKKNKVTGLSTDKIKLDGLAPVSVN